MTKRKRRRTPCGIRHHLKEQIQIYADHDFNGVSHGSSDVRLLPAVPGRWDLSAKADGGKKVLMMRVRKAVSVYD